jgi:hypothetical protein
MVILSVVQDAVFSIRYEQESEESESQSMWLSSQDCCQSMYDNTKVNMSLG